MENNNNSSENNTLSENNPNKPSKLKKGYTFDDGSKIKKKLFFNNEYHYVIFLDQNNNVKYKVEQDGGSLDKLDKIGIVVTELSLISNKFRKDLNLFLAQIYESALLGEEEISKHNLDILIEKINSRKKIIKRLVYLTTPIIWTILYYLFYLVYLHKIDIFNKYRYLVLFSAIGNYISVATKINKVEFESYETPEFYRYFSTFKYLTSIFSAIMILIFYNSKIINISFGIEDETSIIAILSAVGGYVEGLVPNIFDSISKKMKK